MAQSVYNYDTRIEPVADGIIDLLQKNLSAQSYFKADAKKGDTRIEIGNTLRFEKGEQILIRDKNSVWNPAKNLYKGLGFYTIDSVSTPSWLNLTTPLEQDFSVSNGAWIQKTIKNAPLQRGDIYYGDRAVVTWDYVAICIEPDSMTPTWLALNGVLTTEYKMMIMVYVRLGSTNDTQNLATRVCHAYADAIHRLLIGNIHVDLDVIDIPLMADAHIGDNFVYISSEIADEWYNDPQHFFEVQDDFSRETVRFLDYYSSFSSSSSSQSVPPEWSSQSSHSSIFESSISSFSSSSSSKSSVNSTSSSSSSESPSSFSTLTSTSSADTPPGVKVMLKHPLRNHYGVRNKAVLRKRQRYLYDSRVTDIMYGEMQKGEYVKVSALSWFGKETQGLNMAQLGKGGNSYQ